MSKGEIKFLEYDPSLGRDTFKGVPIDFDPLQCRNTADAAIELHRALTELAVAWGQNASEVMLQRPDASKKAGTGYNWRVIWEAGPHNWAVFASNWIHGRGWYTEPYYGFDLCFEDL